MVHPSITASDGWPPNCLPTRPADRFHHVPSSKPCAKEHQGGTKTHEMELNRTPSLVQGSQAKGEPASFAKSPRPIKWYGSRCWTSKTLDEFMLRVAYFKWTVRITIGAPYPNSRTLKSHSYNLYPKKISSVLHQEPRTWSCLASNSSSKRDFLTPQPIRVCPAGIGVSSFMYCRVKWNRIAESLPSHFWVAKWPKKAQFLKGIGTLRWIGISWNYRPGMQHTLFQPDPAIPIRIIGKSRERLKIKGYIHVPKNLPNIKTQHTYWYIFTLSSERRCAFFLAEHANFLAPWRDDSPACGCNWSLVVYGMSPVKFDEVSWHSW